MSNLEVLELYQHAIESMLPQEDEEETNEFKFRFKIATKPQGDCLEIEENRKKLKIRIYLSNLTQATSQTLKPVKNDKYDYAILHVRKVLGCFEGMENKFREFKKLMILIRMWR